jgi:hypothetical protein
MKNDNKNARAKREALVARHGAKNPELKLALEITVDELDLAKQLADEETRKRAAAQRESAKLAEESQRLMRVLEQALLDEDITDEQRAKIRQSLAHGARVSATDPSRLN